MVASTSGRRWPGVDEVVEAYESAQARDGRANLEEFVPSLNHPERLAILCELVRVDLEYDWRRGQPKDLKHYRERFPDLFRDPEIEKAIAFEESRLRRQAAEDSSVHFRLNLEDERPDSPSSNFIREGRDPSSVARGAAPEGATERAALAYRAYRQGRDDGPSELEALFASRQIPREQAELFGDLHRSDPRKADKLAHAVTSLPAPGSRFLGFQIQSELGRGAFGRVYLARQGDLADRPVALKVSADVASETHALAQLQHTNIVPIYSVHRSGLLQAVCMPYLGSTTLADVLKDLRQHETLPDSGAGLLSSHKGRPSATRDEGSTAESEGSWPASPASGLGLDEDQHAAARPTAQIERLRGLGYVQAVLWLGAHVADGLAHAHERGILHRDLKPANILFSDDGEPLLLDFNLAADTKLRIHASAALIGGTLPYMSPEHLAAFSENLRPVDARSDLYSLGVILFELLTGRHPFPIHRGSVQEALPRLIADRQGAPPVVRAWNKQVSPAAESIVRRCLECDPARRYQSARALQEDLQRQLDDLPLKHAPEPSLRERLGKWARRHPRLTSTTTVAVFASCLIAAIVAGSVHRSSRLEAADSLHRLGSKIQEAYSLLGSLEADPRQIEEGVALCDDVLRRYRVFDDPSWSARLLGSGLPDGELGELRRRVGELLLLYGRTLSGQAETTGDRERRAGRIATARRLNALAATCFAENEAPRALWLHRAELARLEGHDGEARKQLELSARVPVRTRLDEFYVAADSLARGEGRDVLPSIHRMPVLARQDFTYWLLLGNGYSGLGQFEEAEFCYSECIAIRPDLVWPYFNRGLASLDMKKPAEARDDFDRVIAMRPDLAVAYVNRALARLDLADYPGAIADLTRALKQPDAPTRAWFIRSRARRLSGDREGAASDRAEGLKRAPADELSWVARGVARLPGDPRGALADFDAALAINPRCRSALQNKASVLSDSLGKTEEAVGILDLALRHHPRSVNALAGRGVLLARLGRRQAAHEDARAALGLDQKASTLYQVAGIYALTSTQDANDRREAFRLMAESLRMDPSWLNVVPKDRDLDPIRDRPEFRELLSALAVLVRDEAPRHLQSDRGK